MTKEERHVPYMLFMLVLSVYAIVALAVSTFVKLPSGTHAILEYADMAVCMVFLADFLITLARAPNRRRYFFTWGWLDLLSSIPAVDALRWGRASRVLRILRVLRGVRATRILSEFILYRRAQSTFLAALLVTILLVVFSASAVLQFETDAEANIRTPEDAVWWAVVTMTTVGYGDRFPLSTEGRLIAVLLMTTGVGLFGTFSGFVAAWFLQAPQHPSNDVEIQSLRSELRQLREVIESFTRRDPPADLPASRPGPDA